MCSSWSACCRSDEAGGPECRPYVVANSSAVGAGLRPARTALSLCYTHMDACRSAQAASWWQRADQLIRDLPEGPEHGLHAWFAGRMRGDAGDIDGHQAQAQKALDIANTDRSRS